MFDDLRLCARLLRGVRAMLAVAAVYALTLQPMLSPVAAAGGGGGAVSLYGLCASEGADHDRSAPVHHDACCCTIVSGQPGLTGGAAPALARSGGFLIQVAAWGQTDAPVVASRRGPLLPRAPPVA